MKRKRKPKPFDVKLSYRLDRAIIASESNDKTRRKMGRIWKRQIERKIWGDE